MDVLLKGAQRAPKNFEPKCTNWPQKHKSAPIGEFNIDSNLTLEAQIDPKSTNRPQTHKSAPDQKIYLFR